MAILSLLEGWSIFHYKLPLPCPGSLSYISRKSVVYFLSTEEMWTCWLVLQGNTDCSLGRHGVSTLLRTNALFSYCVSLRWAPVVLNSRSTIRNCNTRGTSRWIRGKCSRPAWCRLKRCRRRLMVKTAVTDSSNSLLDESNMIMMYLSSITGFAARCVWVLHLRSSRLHLPKTATASSALCCWPSARPTHVPSSPITIATATSLTNKRLPWPCTQMAKIVCIIMGS